MREEVVEGPWSDGEFVAVGREVVPAAVRCAFASAAPACGALQPA